MKHPLAKLQSATRQPLFWALLVWTLGLFAVFQLLDPPLRTAAAPAGIVSFELAGSAARAAQIVASWDTPARLNASFGLGFDFLFMPSYAAALALGTLLAAGRHPGWFARLGNWLGWGALAAAVFDAVENIALYQILLGTAALPWPPLAAGCATIKFGLLLLGTLYALAGWWVPKREPAS